MFLKLAFAGFLGGLLLIANPSLRMSRQGLTLIALGVLSLVLANRGIGRREPGSRRAAGSPTFAADDPEVAALPTTTTTHLSEQIKRSRERQKRAQD